jgi:hypothetical protein
MIAGHLTEDECQALLADAAEGSATVRDLLDLYEEFVLPAIAHHDVELKPVLEQLMRHA